MICCPLGRGCVRNMFCKQEVWMALAFPNRSYSNELGLISQGPSGTNSPRFGSKKTYCAPVVMLFSRSSFHARAHVSYRGLCSGWAA